MKTSSRFAAIALLIGGFLSTPAWACLTSQSLQTANCQVGATCHLDMQVCGATTHARFGLNCPQGSVPRTISSKWTSNDLEIKRLDLVGNEHRWEVSNRNFQGENKRLWRKFTCDAVK